MPDRPTPRRDKRDLFLYWWPVTARLAGLAGAFLFGGYAVLAHSSPDAGVLAFCGALILVPALAPRKGDD